MITDEHRSKTTVGRNSRLLSPQSSRNRVMSIQSNQSHCVPKFDFYQLQYLCAYSARAQLTSLGHLWAGRHEGDFAYETPHDLNRLIRIAACCDACMPPSARSAYSTTTGQPRAARLNTPLPTVEFNPLKVDARSCDLGLV
jgi:hypothetical protein